MRVEHKSKGTQEPRGGFGALFYGVQEKEEFDCSGANGAVVCFDGRAHLTFNTLHGLPIIHLILIIHMPNCVET